MKQKYDPRIIFKAKPKRKAARFRPKLVAKPGRKKDEDD